MYLGKNKLTLQIKTGRFKFLEIKFHNKGTYAKTFMLSNAATAMGFTGDDNNFTMTHIKKTSSTIKQRNVLALVRATQLELKTLLVNLNKFSVT